MIVEQRTYTLHPGKLQEMLDVYTAEGMETHRRILGNQLGYFYTEIGPLNQVVHMYGYESLDDRARRRAELAADPTWQAYIKKGVTYFQDMESKILLPTSFSPIR
ncbi:MAG: NIPSNAP family protein [Rhodospirillaceae bacterium]|nr:NIPSNAP family protein [Rhodospirillaceae bacterium]